MINTEFKDSVTYKGEKVPVMVKLGNGNVAESEVIVRSYTDALDNIILKRTSMTEVELINENGRFDNETAISLNAQLNELLFKSIFVNISLGNLKPKFAYKFNLNFADSKTLQLEVDHFLMLPDDLVIIQLVHIDPSKEIKNRDPEKRYEVEVKFSDGVNKKHTVNALLLENEADEPYIRSSGTFDCGSDYNVNVKFVSIKCEVKCMAIVKVYDKTKFN